MRTWFTLYVAQSVLLLKARVAMTRCSSFIWVVPHGARYFRAYVIARKLFSARTNSMNSWSLSWNSNLLCKENNCSIKQVCITFPTIKTRQDCITFMTYYITPPPHVANKKKTYHDVALWTCDYPAHQRIKLTVVQHTREIFKAPVHGNNMRLFKWKSYRKLSDASLQMNFSLLTA